MPTGSNSGECKYNLGREYKFYATIPPGQRSKGGTAVAIIKEIAHKRLNIKTTLQAIVLVVFMAGKRRRTIYLPVAELVTEENKRDLLEQLSAHMILLEDCNAHNPLWGKKK